MSITEVDINVKNVMRIIAKFYNRVIWLDKGVLKLFWNAEHVVKAYQQSIKRKKKAAP